jgi:peptidyl-prolyl cis-trans isomerase B (cyclophilin B)
MRTLARPLLTFGAIAGLAIAPAVAATPARAAAPVPAGTSQPAVREVADTAVRASRTRGPRVVLETVLGDIVLELHPEDAPQTVANFTKLVKQGFYDSLTFHRVSPGFVLQAGDPSSRDQNPFNDGRGGPGYTLPAEIRAKHTKGAVAMARQPDDVNPERRSNGSQFYIALRELPHLDGAYTVFAQVVSGWDAIGRIEALTEQKDIARQGNDFNPMQLAMIRRARVLPPVKTPATTH